MQNRRKTMGAVTVQLYSGRQPRRPHYLAKLMERHDKSRADIIEGIGVDKGLLSKWLDEEKPTTPGKAWAKALGEFFALSPDPEDFVDIFSDPDLARFQRMTRGMSDTELDRLLTTLEAAYLSKRAGAGG